MELLHFLKQKRSWQSEPLRLSIYLLNACKGWSTHKGRAALGMGHVDEKSVPTLGACWGQSPSGLPVFLYPVPAKSCRCDMLCFIILHQHSQDSWPVTVTLVHSKLSVFPPGLSSDGAFDTEISKVSVYLNNTINKISHKAQCVLLLHLPERMQNIKLYFIPAHRFPHA